MNWGWLLPFVIVYFFVRKGLHFLGVHWRFKRGEKPQRGDGACRLCEDGWHEEDE